MIIAAIDPHRDDRCCAALGLMLAQVRGAPLVLASAYAVDPPADNLYAEYAEAARDATQQALDRLRATLPGRDVDVSAIAVADGGSPAGAIHRLAVRTKAELIVVGSSARGPVGRMLPGAVTDRLLHGAPCPVAVAPAGFSADDASSGLDVIGVAFIERADGRAALAWAREVARAAHAQLRLLNVPERGDSRRAELLEPGVELLAGRPESALAAASTELDLLVCGSRGYGPVRTVLMGSIAHAMVRDAACPVVLVPLPDGEPRAAAGDGSATVTT
jgi:nucleotide-binding universal stress UspA family protein